MTTIVIWLSAACALALIGWQVRNELWLRSLQERKPLDATEFEQLLTKARVDFAHLAEQVEEMIEEARSQRHRAAGARGGRGNKREEEQQPLYLDLNSYKRALERGAKRDPETEKRLGWH